MSDWENSVIRAREEFLEGMVPLGFTLEADRKSLRGVLVLPPEIGQPEISLEIQLPDEFPFKAPKVRPDDGTIHRSWHCEPDGWLCLYSDSDTIDLPWCDPKSFVLRIIDWLRSDKQGWSEDEPDLDLDRYFQRIGRAIRYEDISRYIGKPVRAKYKQGILEIDRALAPILKGKSPKGVCFGWVDDLGELSLPIRDWESIVEVLGDRANRLKGLIKPGGYEFLLLRYTRHGCAGAVILFVTTFSPINLKAGYILDVSQANIRLRAGAGAREFEKHSVAIVGLGAIGSFLADLLARSGIGKLTLKDEQKLFPGNCVRHLAGLLVAGGNKAEAVKTCIHLNGYMKPENITVDPKYMRSPFEAHQLLAENDVVIDATGSGPACTMLSFVAKATNRKFLSVCIQRDGDIIRCDRWPLVDGEEHLPEVPPAPSPKPSLHQSGCGEPISPTPPYAVIAAALLAFRLVEDLLTGQSHFGPSTIEVLRPQDDEPYDVQGLQS